MAVVRAPRRLLTAPETAPSTTPAPARAPEKRADLRVVRPAPRSALVKTAFAVAALFAVFFALVVFHTVMLQNQQRLDKLDDDVDTAQSNYEHLRLEVAQLEAPQRVVDAATQKLGMVPAGTTTYLTPPAPDARSTTAPLTTGPSTTTPAPGDTNDLPPDENTWPQVKPYMGGAKR